MNGQPPFPSPYTLLAGFINAVTAPQRALLQSLGEVGRRSTENRPKVEKELLKFHAAFLRNSLDIVNAGIRELEAQEEAARAAHRRPPTPWGAPPPAPNAWGAATPVPPPWGAPPSAPNAFGAAPPAPGAHAEPHPLPAHEEDAPRVS